MLRFGFDTLKLRTITAVCGELNVASLRVLDKLGFTEESRAIESHAKWPEPRVQIRLRVTPGAWQVRRDALHGSARMVT